MVNVLSQVEQIRSLELGDRPRQIKPGVPDHVKRDNAFNLLLAFLTNCSIAVASPSSIICLTCYYVVDYKYLNLLYFSNMGQN